MPPIGIRPPPAVFGEGDGDDVDNGRLSSGEMATWFGNALVLGSLGTLALIVNSQNERGHGKSIKIISDLLLTVALGVLLWATSKYFLVAHTKHHWSTYILLVFVAATLAAFIWLAVVV